MRLKTAVCAGLLLFTIASRAVELKIVRGDGQYPPYEMQENGALSGLHVDLINHIARQIGCTVTWQSVPWLRAQSMIRSGEADAITFMSRTPERETFAIFLDDNTLSVTRSALFVLAGNPRHVTWNQNLAGLEPYTIGVLRGYAYSPEFDQAASLKKMPVAATNEQLLQMLHAGRFDLAVGDMDQFRYLSRHGKNMPAIEFLAPPLAARPNYLAFSRAGHNAALARQFAETLAAFKKTARYTELVARYRQEE
ncbi:substrate-binding periplasmic protein [Paludibacterium paludis]|nr:transporter substrate-binding domain-containing protein [Paludibacterium paludis]